MADVCGPCAAYDYDVALLEGKLLVASEILFNLTGQRWPGRCTDTIRPCSQQTPGVAFGSAIPSWSGQQVSATGRAAQSALWGVCGCNTSSGCGCGSMSIIRLPRRPVTGIEAILIDGVLLDPAFYRIDDYRDLVYLPGAGDTRQGWPCCQYMERPTTDEGTFQIVVEYGTPPPLAGVDAAASLGCQLALSLTNPSACILPKRIQNVSRQGLSMSFVDDLKMMREGWTGLSDVDMWLSSLEVAKARRAPGVYHPDRYGPKARRTTG